MTYKLPVAKTIVMNILFLAGNFRFQIAGSGSIKIYRSMMELKMPEALKLAAWS